MKKKREKTVTAARIEASLDEKETRKKIRGG
jgi:hypothetical protein